MNVSLFAFILVFPNLKTLTKQYNKTREQLY